MTTQRHSGPGVNPRRVTKMSWSPTRLVFTESLVKNVNKEQS